VGIPAKEESRDFLAVSKNSLASAYRAAGDPELAAQTYRESLAIREQLVTEHPENTSYRRLLLITYGHLGDALGPPDTNGLGQLPESVKAFEKAASIAAWISQHDPSDRKAWFDLIAAQMRAAASLLEEPAGAAEALDLLAHAEVLLTRLIHEDPLNQRYRLYALTLEGHRGKALMALRRDAEAVRWLERTRSDATGLRGGPVERNARSWGLAATLRLAQISARRGSASTALSLANETAAGVVNGGLFGSAWSRALFYRHLGTLYSQIRQPKPAREWLEKSAAIWRAMTVPAPLEAQRRKALTAVEQDLDSL
jgi:tetratricopeptide (TPR) repeat protein